MSGPSQRGSSRNWRIHVVVWAVIILISVVGPSYFLVERAGKFLVGKNPFMAFILYPFRLLHGVNESFEFLPFKLFHQF